MVCHTGGQEDLLILVLIPEQAQQALWGLVSYG